MTPPGVAQLGHREPATPVTFRVRAVHPASRDRTMTQLGPNWDDRPSSCSRFGNEAAASPCHTESLLNRLMRCSLRKRPTGAERNSVTHSHRSPAW